MSRRYVKRSIGVCLVLSLLLDPGIGAWASPVDAASLESSLFACQGLSAGGLFYWNQDFSPEPLFHVVQRDFPRAALIGAVAGGAVFAVAAAWATGRWFSIFSVYSMAFVGLMSGISPHWPSIPSLGGGEQLFTIPASALRKKSGLTENDVVWSSPMAPYSGNSADIQKLIAALTAYGQWRQEAELGEWLPPWTSGIAVVSSGHGSQIRDPVGVPHIVVQESVIRKIRSPLRLLIYLRHQRQKFAGYAEDVIIRGDLRLIEECTSLYPQLLDDFEQAIDAGEFDWPGYSGYGELLRSLRQAASAAEANERIDLFVTRQLAAGEMLPSWPFSLNRAILVRLRALAGDSEADKWVFEAMLNGSGANRSEFRDAVRRQFTDASGQFNSVVYQTAPGVREPFGPVSTATIMAWRRLVSSAVRIWADMNENLGFDDTAEQVPVLRSVFESYVNLLRAYLNDDETREIDAEKRLVIMHRRLPAIMRHGMENEGWIRHEMRDLLRSHPNAAVQFGLLLADIARASPELLEECTGLAQSFEDDRLLKFYHERKAQQALEDRGEAFVQKLLRRAAAKGQPLTARDEAHVRFILSKAMSIHADEKRKDKVTLAYTHQLRVLEIALDVFNITDPLILQIIALHDSLEDRSEKFEDLMKEIETWIGPVDDEIRYHMIRLGVRMLSYLKGLTRDEAEAVCYQGLRDPESVYGAMPEFRTALDLLAKDPNLRRRILHGLQLAKLADRMSNWEDFDYFLKTGFDLETATRSQVELPGKTFDKTIHSMNPNLTNQPDLLVSAEELEAYYGFLANLIRQYVEMSPSRYPQAVPRRLAAMDALRGLTENMRGVPAHHRSANLDAIADRLHRYLPMASADRLPGPWDKAVAGARVTCSYAHDALSIFTSPTSWSLRTGPVSWGSDGAITVKGAAVADEALSRALRSTVPEFTWNGETKIPSWVIFVTPELLEAFKKARIQTRGRVGDVRWQMKVHPAPKIQRAPHLWNPQLLARVTGLLALAVTWSDGWLLRLKTMTMALTSRQKSRLLATAS